jgi:DNA end-binding protein Ku
MPTRKRSKKKSAGGPRASWKGNLVFGLVTFPVQAVNALNRQEGDIHFHQLHAGCHRRIQYQKMCPVHGELTQDDIVSGYEFKKGKYVEITPEELESMRTDEQRALSIDAFVDPDAVDPLYFDGRMYYLLPDGNAALEPYAVVLGAMQHENRYGIGQLVLSGKKQLALIRPLKSVLHMAMLNYDEELKSPDELAPARLPRADARKLKLAKSLISQWSTDEFDFGGYDDEYRDRLQELIDAKLEGREIVATEAPEPAAAVNLMEALKQSLSSRPGRSRRGARRKTG